MSENDEPNPPTTGPAAAGPTEERPDSATDRYNYSRVALARLVLSADQQHLATTAAAGVPTTDEYAEPGDLLRECVEISRDADLLVTRAVIYERERGSSWEEIGEALGMRRQSAHAHYHPAVDQWRAALHQPFDPDYPEPAGGGWRPLRLHEAAYEPTMTARQLDRWVSERVPVYGEHPVSGHLPQLDPSDELAEVQATIQQATAAGAPPAVRATLYDRKARALERAAEGRPEVREQAAEARARAEQLRNQNSERNN